MKIRRKIFAIIVALVILLVPVMQVSAAGKPQYISEIRIGYGEDGKAALEEEGFAVWTDLNANEGGNGSEVWLGYKTTDNANEAITDISLMNMQGGYSFDAYTKEIENLNKQISQQLAGFKAAIDEFRSNYKQESAFAISAYDAINCFYDDDTTDEAGTPVGIGDLFLDEATSDETLHRIFLEGNTDAVSAIETALAIACIETEENTVLTRLEDSEYPEALNPETNAARTALKNVFEDFHSEAIGAKAAADKINGFEGGAEAFFAQNILSDEELVSYAVELSRYNLLSETSFGNTGMSLLDFALLDETEENENGEVLEDEYLEMLADSMTDGQLGIVSNVGILTILVNASAAEDADMEEAEQENVEAVSVYYGVDRSLFEDIDSIALTSDALREKAAAEGNDFGKDASVDRTKAIAFTSAAAVAYTAGAVILSFSIKAAMTPIESYELVSHEMTYHYWSEYETVLHVNTAGVAMTVVGCIAIIAAVVLTIFAILQWIEKPTVPDTEYTQIPRVIVEKNEEDDSFIPYYAAKLAGAAEDETDSTKLYGDLNGLNGIDQWVGLYYTTNPDSGKPITEEMLISSDGVLSNSQAEKYAAVHMFGSTSAANLNQYNTKEGAKAIYIFLRTDNNAVSQTGSIFTTGTVVTGIAAFAVGAGIAAAVTYLLTRKKKSEAVED